MNVFGVKQVIRNCGIKLFISLHFTDEVQVFAQHLSTNV